MESLIFDALCLGCGKRKGIQLPRTNTAMVAIDRCKIEAFFRRCSCGGEIDIKVYEGSLDDKRNVKEK